MSFNNYNQHEYIPAAHAVAHSTSWPEWKWCMQHIMKTLLILTLLLGDFRTPPTSAKELYFT